MSEISFPYTSVASPTEINWSLVTNTRVFESPFTRTSQVLEMPGARWKATMRWVLLTKIECLILRAFLASLRGRSVAFTLYDYSHPTPRGAYTGTPLVYGASQTGSTLNTDGWTHTSDTMLVGDYFSVNNELKIITKNSTSEGGVVTLTFEPPLRSSPDDNAPLDVLNPSATMRLTSDSQNSVTISGSVVRDFSIECEEVI